MKKQNKAFGRALREIRREKGYTQESLAFECGLDRTYISLLELGSNSPTLDTILSLCRALDTPLSAFAVRIENHLRRKRS